jgi:hypothetical protein
MQAIPQIGNTKALRLAEAGRGFANHAQNENQPTPLEQASLRAQDSDSNISVKGSCRYNQLK